MIITSRFKCMKRKTVTQYWDMNMEGTGGGGIGPILVSDIDLVSAIKNKYRPASKISDPSASILASAYIGVPNVQHAEPTWSQQQQCVCNNVGRSHVSRVVCVFRSSLKKTLQLSAKLVTHKFPLVAAQNRRSSIWLTSSDQTQFISWVTSLDQAFFFFFFKIPHYKINDESMYDSCWYCVTNGIGQCSSLRHR